MYRNKENGTLLLGDQIFIKAYKNEGYVVGVWKCDEYS